MGTIIAGFIAKITVTKVIGLVIALALAGVVCKLFFGKDKWEDRREEED
jgi:hypothetical protein